MCGVLKEYVRSVSDINYTCLWELYHLQHSCGKYVDNQATNQINSVETGMRLRRCTFPTWIWCKRLSLHFTSLVPEHGLGLTSWRIDGSVPPSLSLPQPVTVAFSPISRSSDAGRQIGAICGAKLRGESSRTSARSYSYVKKLYLGCTTLRPTPLSTKGYGSWTLEKSYSPTRIRIWDVRRLQTHHIV